MCNASDYAVGVVLGQRIDKKPYIIYYARYILNKMQVDYIVTKKEFLAIIFGFKKFRPYLMSHVIAFTDHVTLKHLVEKKDAKPRLITWIMLLLEFDCEIKDRKVSENPVADHLCRIVINDASKPLSLSASPINNLFGLMWSHGLVTEEMPRGWTKGDRAQ